MLSPSKIGAKIWVKRSNSIIGRLSRGCFVVIFRHIEVKVPAKM